MYPASHKNGKSEKHWGIWGRRVAWHSTPHSTLHSKETALDAARTNKGCDTEQGPNVAF